MNLLAAVGLSCTLSQPGVVEEKLGRLLGKLTRQLNNCDDRTTVRRHKTSQLLLHLLQVFPEDQPGIYINKLQLGPIRADLSANYEYSGADKIDVSFIDIAAFLGPLQLIRKVCTMVMLCTCAKWSSQMSLNRTSQTVRIF